ncbi:MAG: magnesium transporter [Anaerolineales bacterium]|nr:MAG: magnesium transporter [Anaerolineales bacterium]
MKPEALDEVLAELRISLERDDLNKAIAIIEALSPADQADLVEVLDSPDQLALFAHLDPADSADMLEEMENQEAAALAELLSSAQLADILDEMEDDEAADILGDLPAEKVSATLREMEEPKDVIPLLRYPDDTAGGLMTRAVITLRPGWTANDALTELRRVGPRSDSTYYLFVIDEQEKLLGVIGLRELVTAPVETRIADLMWTDVVSVIVTTDQEECALVLSKYGYLALPVVDEIGRFVGVITADDLIEVAEDEATEDMYLMVGITGEERAFDPARQSILKRLPWLAINIVTLFIAISVVDAFEAVIAGMVALAVFLPVVSGEGGNAGSQTATVIVRGIALGEVGPRDVMRSLTRELRIALVNGVVIGLGTGLVVYIWKGDWRIAVAVLLAMILNFLMAAATGVLIPLGLQKMKVDPALASAAFVTGFTDTFGFLFFLGIASLLM